MILPDFKGRDGRWVMQVFVEKGLTYWTVAGCLWSNMNRRCRAKFKEEYPTYEHCRHTFKDFNDFAEWCQSQVGYGVEGYQLDKDILVKGNKVYSKDTCAFVPEQVNYLFIKCDRARGKYPVGVCQPASMSLFKAQLKIKKKTTHLGHFPTVEEAHAAYKAAKEKLIKSYAEEYKNKIDDRVYKALVEYEVEITD